MHKKCKKGDDIWRTKSCAFSGPTVKVAVISAAMWSNPATTLLIFTMPVFLRCMKWHAMVHRSMSGEAAAYIDEDINLVEKCDRQPQDMRRSAYIIIIIMFA